MIYYLVISILAGYGIWNTHYLKSKKITINKNDNYKESVEIIHISDLHSKTKFVNGSLYKKINQYDAKYILITGDLADSEEQFHKVIRELKKIGEDKQIYIVLGNHERKEGKGLNKKEVTNLQERIQILAGNKNIFVLINEHVILEDSILLYGFDNSVYGKEADNISNLKLSNVKYRIIMAHSPGIVNYIEEHDIAVDLVLVGHTHGNQINLPFAGKIVNREFEELQYGLKERGKYLIHISKGIGTSGIPLRINSIPELTLIKIRF